MIRIHVLCEGKTERLFVRDVLAEHFISRGISLIPRELNTSRRQKGGVSTYGKIRNQIIITCKEDRGAYVTTMIDYYGFPADFPGRVSAASSYESGIKTEEQLYKDIGCDKFIANLMIHEFEALLFSDPDCFVNYYDHKIIQKLKNIRSDFETPEHINDSKETAPSKRLDKACKKFNKVLSGSQIAKEIGIETMRKQCKHFDSWLRKLEALA